MAKPRTAPPSAPKTAQDSKPAAAPAVTEEKPADITTVQPDPPVETDADTAVSASPVANQVLAPTETTTAADAGNDAGASASPVTLGTTDAVDVGAGIGGIVDSHDGAASAPVCFEVLTPFKFRGSVVKPPAWIEMSEDEAALYQAAGVLGIDPAEPFDHV